jgi:hypothetical protein
MWFSSVSLPKGFNGRFATIQHVVHDGVTLPVAASLCAIPALLSALESPPPVQAHRPRKAEMRKKRQ